MGNAHLLVAGQSVYIKQLQLYDIKSNYPSRKHLPSNNTPNTPLLSTIKYHHINIQIDSFLFLLFPALHTQYLSKSIIKRMQVKSLKGTKSGFFLYTSSHSHQSNFSFSVYLVHQRTDDLFVIIIKDSVKVSSAGMQIAISPRKIAGMIEESDERVRVNEKAEMEMELDMLGQRVSIKLPPPIKDQSRHVIAEVRMRQLQKRLSDRISLLQEQKGRLSNLVQSLQSDLAQFRRRHNQSRLPEYSPRLSVRQSSTVDEEINSIIRRVQQDRNFPAVLKQEVEKAIRNTLDKNHQTQAYIVRNAIGAATANFTHVVDKIMREIFGKMEVVEKRLETLCSQKEKQPTRTVRQASLFAHLQPEAEKSESNLIHTFLIKGGVKILNCPMPFDDPEDIYCYFFSQHPLRQDISLRLHFSKGDKPLLGICSREALQVRPIYNHKAAFFHTLSDGTWHLGGNKEDEQFASEEGEVMGEKEAVMRFKADQGVIMWESEGRRAKHWFQKGFLEKNELHVAVLLKRQMENQVFLEYYH